MRPNTPEHDSLQVGARTVLNSLSAHIAILDENGWIKEQVLPFVEKLAGMPLGPQGRSSLQIIRERLGEIVSPFLNRLSTARIFLTPQEIQVAGLVRDGKASKEIATVLNVSKTTVHFHRKNLRKKLGLTSRRANLRAHLMSLAQ